ncbi:hypothetical protein NPIL_381621 [Nephila pilipes]|uniref:Reverse transcriptase/retrotransposon-derived protein RNase H-like domain-containing protein n=1 Tax=Nephila pilipes TaxID=299642 RepID=A0A8X6MWX3_NEPPI|nr:hypothetical protein NPIL_381621 [Nephila pilipes]
MFQALDSETTTHIEVLQEESWFKPKELVFKILVGGPFSGSSNAGVPYQVYCDASDHGVGSCELQQD